MKKLWWFLLMGNLFVFLAGTLWADDAVRVQVRQAVVRARASFLGEVVAKLPYGTRVEVLDRQGSWSRIRANEDSVTGWLATSTISNAKIETNVGQAGTTASGNETALAGKGFSDQIEQNYQATNHVDYTWVNRMEKIQPPDSILRSFERDGPQGAFQ